MDRPQKSTCGKGNSDNILPAVAMGRGKGKLTVPALQIRKEAVRPIQATTKKILTNTLITEYAARTRKKVSHTRHSDCLRRKNKAPQEPRRRNDVD
jgi:hypothetical protein